MAYPGDGEDEREGQDSGAPPFAEEEQLILGAEDDALPWLEADDEEEEPGFDWRLITYGVAGLAVVAALLGAIWWFTRDRGDPELLADGSTITAPAGPYKQQPDDAGGAEVAGTGDQAFQVAEGESTRGRIASNDGGSSSDARPAIDTAQGETQGETQGRAGGEAQAESPAETAGETDASSAVYVQIGAFGSRADADAAWVRESGRFSALSGMRHRVVEGDVNGAKVYRLQAIAADRSGAEATCRSIRNAGGDCYIR